MAKDETVERTESQALGRDSSLGGYESRLSPVLEINEDVLRSAAVDATLLEISSVLPTLGQLRAQTG